MTCAETRRQLPAPDPAQTAAVAAHLDDCVPCRAESDALKEIDRRLQRLGQSRALRAQPALVTLTQRAQEQLGVPLPVPAARPYWLLGLLVLLATAALSFWVLRHR